MASTLGDLHVSDGDAVATKHIPKALTAGGLVYDDGAASYVEQGRSTEGEWYLDDDGRFCSFWPPSYRARYNLHWIAEDGRIVGLRFIERGSGSGFNGRYR